MSRNGFLPPETTMPDKKQCCHRGCHNSRVTFEDAVVAQIQWKGVIVPEYWFGFYCQKCKDEDSAIYQRFVENKIKDAYRDWETDRKSTRLNSSHRL